MCTLQMCFSNETENNVFVRQTVRTSRRGKYFQSEFVQELNYEMLVQIFGLTLDSAFFGVFVGIISTIRIAVAYKADMYALSVAALKLSFITWHWYKSM